MAVLVLGLPVLAQKKPLDHSVYDGWKSIRQRLISGDGRWIAWSTAPQEGDGTATVASATDSAKRWEMERGTGMQFTDDSRHLLMTITPKKEDLDKAEKDKTPADRRPKNMLRIVDLQKGENRDYERIASWSLDPEGLGWVMIRPEPEPASKEPEKKEGAAGQEPEKPAEKKEEEETGKRKGHAPGREHRLLNLNTGEEKVFAEAADFRFSEKSDTLLIEISSKDGSQDGLLWIDLKTGQEKRLTVRADFSRLALSEDGRRAAYFSDEETYRAEKPESALYAWSWSGEPRKLAGAKTPGLREGWRLSSGPVRFSRKAGRLFFGTQPIPAPEPKEKPEVKVDIWHYQDPMMKPQEILRAAAMRNQSYEAMIEFSGGPITQLEDEKISTAAFPRDDDGRHVLLESSKPYEIEASWDTSYSDYDLLDLQTGARTRLATKFTGLLAFSPTGRFIVMIDAAAKTVEFRETATGRIHALAPESVAPLFDELHDTPSNPDTYGLAGWTKDDARLIAYDRYDIWSIDPTGAQAPVNLTDGRGRLLQTRYRHLRLDREEEAIPTDGEALLSVFNERTKASGWAMGRLGRPAAPYSILVEDAALGGLQKAEKADRIIFSRQTFAQYGEITVADGLDFSGQRVLSDTNPQQKDFNWGTTELISYRSLDGEELQGIIVKPENFDPNKQYPMIAYFYERDSDGLHGYRPPAPSASTINWTLFASNEYIIFVPDIPYKIGYPGESAVNAIIPGVQKVLDQGYVDPKRVGIQGQSWGGYQVAYLVTESDMFAAAWAGAPVGNMFSAYGGIRWGSGLVRQFQYERTQSRIGDSIWEKPLRYLENSPLFFLDKVKTPLAIMSNDKDGAVPWYQGIELFAGMRRLGKPCWLLVYNEEDHNLVQRKNRKDLSVRLSQFFDHYLKGAPAPVWMTNGVKSVDKERTLGLEIKGGL
jgi:dipeptidyl aminopeptidase/acylaminoacyl peptidase